MPATASTTWRARFATSRTSCSPTASGSCRSAAYTRINLPHTAGELEAIARKVLRANCEGLDPGDDRILWIIATRGVDPPSRNPLDAAAPTVMIYTLPINYHRFAKAYRVGAHLITATTRRTPPECLDPRAKITNKMNHIQAELEVKAVDRDAIPLMLGTDGTVAEASWANAFFVKDGRVFTPRPKNILLGIMRENVLEVAPSGRRRGDRRRLLSVRFPAGGRDLPDDDELLHPAHRTLQRQAAVTGPGAGHHRA